MKKFFRSMEEKFVFPIGRRTWQILALTSLLGLSAFIVWYVINATPTSREEVVVSKLEVINNQVDTVSHVKSLQENTECNQSEYNKYMDSIRKDLPRAEWIKLGDSSEPYNDYVLDEYGNYLTDDYGNYIITQKRNYISNPVAIPNIINDIYLEWGLDSSMLCEKIKLLKLLHQLNKLAQSDYLNKEAFSAFADLLSRNRNIDETLILNSAQLKSRIDGAELIIQNRESLTQFMKYVEYVNRKNISEEQIQICIKTLDQHRKIPSPIFNKKDYFDLAQIMFEANIPVEELSVAMQGFQSDIEYYDRNDLEKSLSRYLKLYQEKLSMANMEKERKELKKAGNRYFSLLAMGICFVSVISIATILLLYSIQQLLKEHTQKNV